jgi:SAM-dependent methyltransferase
MRTASLDAGASVLEVGAGTGNFTVGLVGHDLCVTAIEPAANMLRVLGKRLPQRACRTIQARFEDCHLPHHAFDGIFACHSWHWLDKSSRMQRCSTLLRPGGHLCIVYNVHVGDEDARFGIRRREIYGKWAPEIEHLDPPPIKLDAARAEITKFAAAGPIKEVTAGWSHRFTAIEFAALLGSYSNHIVLPPGRRNALLSEVRRLIDSEFGGAVRQTYATVALITAVNSALSTESS